MPGPDYKPEPQDRTGGPLEQLRQECAGVMDSYQEDVARVLDIAMRVNAQDDILRFFAFKHLPPKLARISCIFAGAACATVNLIPVRSAERTVALRKLLEAKDAAVRAAL